MILIHPTSISNVANVVVNHTPLSGYSETSLAPRVPCHWLFCKGSKSLLTELSSHRGPCSSRSLLIEVLLIEVFAYRGPCLSSTFLLDIAAKISLRQPFFCSHMCRRYPSNCFLCLSFSCFSLKNEPQIMGSCRYYLLSQS